MWNFKKEIYKTSNKTAESVTVALDPFDYIIITYQYTPPLGEDYDLDTLSTFRYSDSTLAGTNSNNTTGFIPGTGVVGCGVGGDGNIPIGSNFNNGYLFWGQDDVNQYIDGTYGESVIINFKNLELSGITNNPDIILDLYAGWHSGTILYPINIKYETFIGGTLSNEIVNGITTNRFVTTGTSVSTPQISNNINVPIGTCQQGVDIKKKVASIHYNLITNVSNIIFY